MKDSAKLRRHLYLIRISEHPFTYPSDKVLMQHLRDHDFERVSKKTLERDLNEIRGEYGIPIAYDRRKQGYYLALPDDEDLDDFRGYIRLLERRERLETLTRSGRSAGQYIQLELHDGFRGLDLLAPLYTALQRQLVVTFAYRNYTESVARTRRVEPGLLFEFRNRWYLDCYDLDVPEARDGQRTFGLDRMQDVQLTAQPIRVHNGKFQPIDYRAARRHVIGVTAPPDRQPERVVLRFYDYQREYVRSLPLHHSQQIIADDAYLDISLYVVLNPELERDLLAYGEHVEVLEPQALREKLVIRIRAMATSYKL